MSGNTFGTIFKITSFGESHGTAIGGVIDGCPAGIKLNFDFIQSELNRRKPSQSFYTSHRNEEEKVEFLSGIFEDITTGTPIAYLIKNSDVKSGDYESIKTTYRPSHADFVYDAKYGIRDYRGGGRSSARETASRVVGGAIAKHFLQKHNISIMAYVCQIGNIKLEKHYSEIDLSTIEKSEVKCPDIEISNKMIDLLHEVHKSFDSIGGVITCVIKNVPAGLGEPVFDKLTAQLAKAMMSINASRGVSFGEGFYSAQMKGSEHNDEFIIRDNKIRTKTNHSGGIQGGISNGEDIYFNIAFKPTATIFKEQNTVNTNKEETTIKPKGRHDVCFVPRAVPIVEAMAAITITDFFLIQKGKVL
ncbi:MAG TPA: chorismate synthase [Bacteroidales bacterium]|nr:MAG: chorismate synthase [Bacteroidetes bacterium GWF2_33_38]OFY68106.1 MAG: chorismate synthase [Bacteroidetes bacterium RIFOXYA12_FULL_33_9]HBF88673.1 chorismate synthase [Bacteroidales bacterium]